MTWTCTGFPSCYQCFGPVNIDNTAVVIRSENMECRRTGSAYLNAVLCSSLINRKNRSGKDLLPVLITSVFGVSLLVSAREIYRASGQDDVSAGIRDDQIKDLIVSSRLAVI